MKHQARWPAAGRSGQVPATEEQVDYFDRLHRTMGDLAAAIRAMAPVLIDTRTVILDSTGSAEASFRVPYRSVTIASQSRSLLTISPGPRGGSAPASGPGVALVQAGATTSFNISGYSWAIYGGTAGEQVTVQTFGAVQPPGSAGSNVLTGAVVASPFSAASLSGYGAVTSAAALATIATTGVLPAGLYDVTAQGYLTGTVAAGDADNMQLSGTGLTAPLLVPPVVSVLGAPRAVRYRAAGGTALVVQAAALATVASIYHATITATQVST